MTRKSPYRHKVHTHIRDGYRVTEYHRGQGKPPMILSKVLIRNKVKGSKYYVTIDGSRHEVQAGSIIDALDSGLSFSTKSPSSVIVRKAG